MDVGEPSTWQAGENINVATDQAQVDHQIGSVETYIHFRQQFNIGAFAAPEEVFRRATTILRSGGSTYAAELIDRAVSDGYYTVEVAYYRSLAILRARPFEHLTAEDLGKLHDGFAKGRACPDDPWSCALRVVELFVNCLVDQEKRDGELDTELFDRARESYHTDLQEERREEVDRHLCMMLPGAMQDRWDADVAEQVAARRMEHDRRRRVPLFFEPDPLPPYPLQDQGRPVGWRPWCLGLLGLATLVVGEWLALDAAVATNPWLVTLATGLWAACAIGILRLAPRQRYLRERRAAKERDLAGAESSGVEETATANVDFVERVDAVIARHFDAALPAGALAYSRRRLLRRQIFAHYSGISDVGPLIWLVRHHASRANMALSTGSDHLFRFELRPSRSAFYKLAAAVAGWMAGTGTLLVLAFLDRPVAATGCAVLIIVSVAAIRGAAPIYDEPRRHVDDQAELDSRHEGELAAFRREQGRLADRPDDDIMARWLDYDKDYIRIQAIRRYTLKNADVIAQFSLAESVPGCRRARMANGPQRYSVYRIRQFLLTHNGVRQVEVCLDFASGAENNERRTVFRYDAIASGSTEPRTVRPRGRRQIATAEGGGPLGLLPKPILRHDFRISLLNGELIEIKIDYDHLLPDEDRENPDALYKLIDDTTGSSIALLILESVAAEGTQWIARERGRSRQKLSEYMNVL